MKILIIQGQPDDQSFAHANAMHSYEVLREDGVEVRFVDLAIDDFDPVLRYGYRARMESQSYIQEVQHKVAWADHICFFFPVWWGAEPFVLKGLIDRAFTPGFAYKRNGPLHVQGLLQGKEASLFLTSDDPAFFQRRYGGVVSHWKRDILGHAGIKLTKTMILGGDRWLNDEEERTDFIDRCSQEIEAMAVRDMHHSLLKELLKK